MLARWDVAFYTERLRRARHAVDQEQFRQHLPGVRTTAYDNDPDVRARGRELGWWPPGKEPNLKTHLDLVVMATAACPFCTATLFTPRASTLCTRLPAKKVQNGPGAVL